ncbi:MAG TPA: TolC family protein [Verrucomicrobiae bacterium]|jgi:outer membrane protein|nr:TolC family protein [Verrucomicrobiae bacterium]
MMRSLRQPRSFLLVVALFFAASRCSSQAQTPPPANPAAQNQAAASMQKLTLQDAQNIAIQNHPQIQAATQLARAAAAQVTEVRSAYYPQASGALTGAEAQSGSRIAAGFLNSPSIYDKFAGGVSVSQLVTDFGRTHELSKSSNYHAQAQQATVVTTRADVLLRVNLDYYNVLKAQAVLRVANETVKDRQLVTDQVTQMAKSSLKSGLDVSFANVDLSRAQLLLVQAQNDLQSSYAQLSDALGYPNERMFELMDEPLPGAPPSEVDPLVTEALQSRPELASQRLDLKSAQSYATAERDLWFPTLSAVGVAGLVPYRQDPLPSSYAAAGFDLNVPLFNGRMYNALHTEAVARAAAQEQYLRDLQNRISEDVRTSWLNVSSAYQRLSVTEQLLKEATQAFDLAQARYKLGLSSIIELSQAQLSLTEAQIDQISAQYDYESQTANLNYQLGRMR